MTQLADLIGNDVLSFLGSSLPERRFGKASTTTLYLMSDFWGKIQGKTSSYVRTSLSTATQLLQIHPEIFQRRNLQVLLMSEGLLLYP